MLENRYDMAKIGDGLNPHVKRSVRLWLWCSVVAFAVFCWAMVYVPIFSPRDPDVMLRWLDLRLIRVIFAFLTLGAFWTFLEIKTNGNLLGQILQSPVACSVLMSAVFLGTVALVIYG